MATSQTLFIAWAFGAFASFGFYGFAYAQSAQDLTSQVASISAGQQGAKQQLSVLSRATANNAQQVSAIRTETLDSRILQMRERQCKAIASGNTEAKSFATERLQSFLQSFQDLTGRVYRLPGCDEL